MAIKTFYFLNTRSNPPDFGSRLQDGAPAPGGSYPFFGWIVGTQPVAAPYFRGRIGAVERAPSSTGLATSLLAAATGPLVGTDSSATGAADFWRSEIPFLGHFAAGNWVFNFDVRTQSPTVTGRMRFRVWASTDPSGAGTHRELTAGVINCSTVNLTVFQQGYISTATWAAPLITLNSEYLFVSVEWQNTAVGSSSLSEVRTYQSTSSITTPDFVYQSDAAVLSTTDTPDGSFLEAQVREPFVQLFATEAQDSGKFEAFEGYEIPAAPNRVIQIWPDPADISAYLDHITSEHNQRPKFVGTISFLVQPLADKMLLEQYFYAIYDLDKAIGSQEDAVGIWVGRDRFMPIAINPYFSWDTEGLGWDQGIWYQSFDPLTGTSRLDDDHYRQLLYAVIAANHWDGTIPGAYDALTTMFGDTAYNVLIQDWGDGSFAQVLIGPGPPDPLVMAMFTTGQINLKPAGIELDHYIPSVWPAGPGGTPLFAFDVENTTMAGWDVGAWAEQVKPIA